MPLALALPWPSRSAPQPLPRAFGLRIMLVRDSVVLWSPPQGVWATSTIIATVVITRICVIVMVIVIIVILGGDGNSNTSTIT